jgi:hypothetical protein
VIKDVVPSNAEPEDQPGENDNGETLAVTEEGELIANADTNEGEQS